MGSRVESSQPLIITSSSSVKEPRRDGRGGLERVGESIENEGSALGVPVSLWLTAIDASVVDSEGWVDTVAIDDPKLVEGVAPIAEEDADRGAGSVEDDEAPVH